MMNFKKFLKGLIGKKESAGKAVFDKIKRKALILFNFTVLPVAVWFALVQIKNDCDESPSRVAQIMGLILKDIINFIYGVVNFFTAMCEFLLKPKLVAWFHMIKLKLGVWVHMIQLPSIPAPHKAERMLEMIWPVPNDAGFFFNSVFLLSDLILLGSLLTLICLAIYSKRFHAGRVARMHRLCAILVVGVCGALAVDLELLFKLEHPIQVPLFNGVLYIDTAYLLVRVAMLLFTVLLFGQVSFWNRTWVRGEFRHTDLAVIVVYGFYIFSLHFLPLVNDMLILYMVLELQGIAGYILAASYKTNVVSVEAGAKYFVLNSLASGVLLAGMAILYGVLGTINFIDCRLLIASNPTLTSSGPVIFSVLLLVSGFAFKLGAAPFHSWVLEAYIGAPLWVMAVFSTLPKLSLLSVLFTFYHGLLFSTISYIPDFVLGLALLSIAVGFAGAVTTTRLRTILAYSSIVNSGYMLYILVNGNIMALIYYVFVYVIGSAAVFLVVGVLEHSARQEIYDVSQLRGLREVNPVLAWTLAAAMLSFSGLPPFLGFFGKLALFSSTFGTFAFGYTTMGVPLLLGGVSATIAIVVFISLVSTLTTIYYIRFINQAFFTPGSGLVFYFAARPYAQAAAQLITNINLCAIYFTDALWYFILYFT